MTRTREIVTVGELIRRALKASEPLLVEVDPDDVRKVLGSMAYLAASQDAGLSIRHLGEGVLKLSRADQ